MRSGSAKLTYLVTVTQLQNVTRTSPFQKPRICVEQQAYAWKASSMPKISKIHQAYAMEACRSSSEVQQAPRICVESYAYASETEKTCYTPNPSITRPKLISSLKGGV
ncbi:hypothetical protein PIB30_110985 [Stylosanthes scabra]|uniref:Uncharacterized protein n=1 Tax=Stylosanthes scabra TaxID=79078 RepID=A0ABU6Y097_9FABA|nr:hypothetical protein [Stylosanthes scabra]